MPKTSSPGLNRLTPSPVASTTPDTSQPRTKGGSPRKMPSARCFQSVGLTRRHGPAPVSRSSRLPGVRQLHFLQYLGAAEGVLADGSHGGYGGRAGVVVVVSEALTAPACRGRRPGKWHDCHPSIGSCHEWWQGRQRRCWSRRSWRCARVVVLALDGVYPFELGIPQPDPRRGRRPVRGADLHCRRTARAHQRRLHDRRRARPRDRWRRPTRSWSPP